MEIKLNINQNDIFDYVVGNSNYDPIEKSIDPVRYEIFDESIYDNFLKVSIPQKEDYKNFCSQVSKLRRESSKMSRAEVISICEELFEIKPEEISIL